MNAGGKGRLRKEQREDFRKGDAGVGHADQGLAAGSAGTVNDDRGSGALLGPGKITLVLGESEVARLGAVRGGKALKDQGGVAEDFASEEFGNFSNGIRHKLLTWITAATIKAAAANSTPTLKAGGDDPGFEPGPAAR